MFIFFGTLVIVVPLLKLNWSLKMHPKSARAQHIPSVKNVDLPKNAWKKIPKTSYPKMVVEWQFYHGTLRKNPPTKKGSQHQLPGPEPPRSQ